jgi:hypothetical protein
LGQGFGVGKGFKYLRLAGMKIFGKRECRNSCGHRYGLIRLR